MSIFLFSCTKELYFSGISENSVDQINKSYLSRDCSNEEILKILGAPVIVEDNDNLWIYSLKKEKGSAAFKKTDYNKTLKLRFKKNILRSVEEIKLN